jgi:ubiquinone/menaquinone biosynthesis C-methylase UbiE
MSDSLQQRAFQRRASGYDRTFLRDRWPRNQEWKANAICAALPVLAADDVVLELGCGTGQVAGLVLEHIPSRYVGVDLAPAMLSRARLRLARFGGRVELREAAAAQLPLGEGEAAAAFGVDVLHHVDDIEAALRELHRVLRPGATAFFLEGNPLFPLNALIAVRAEERGLLRSRPKNYEQWFRTAGFDVEVRPAGLFTPPGPARAARLLDATDRLFARTPGVRALGIFHAITAVRGMFNDGSTGVPSQRRHHRGKGDEG